MAPTNKAPSPWPPTKYRTNARQYNKQIARSHADDGSRMTRCALLCAAAAPMHFDGSCRCDCHRHAPLGLWPMCVCRHRHCTHTHKHKRTRATCGDACSLACKIKATIGVGACALLRLMMTAAVGGAVARTPEYLFDCAAHKIGVCLPCVRACVSVYILHIIHFGTHA